MPITRACTRRWRRCSIPRPGRGCWRQPPRCRGDGRRPPAEAKHRRHAHLTGAMSGREPSFPVHVCFAVAGSGARNPMLGTILVIILILLLIGALPTWPYSSGWGYYPGGGLGLIIIILIILLLLGYIHI